MASNDWDMIIDKKIFDIVYKDDGNHLAHVPIKIQSHTVLVPAGLEGDLSERYAQGSAQSNGA